MQAENLLQPKCVLALGVVSQQIFDAYLFSAIFGLVIFGRNVVLQVSVSAFDHARELIHESIPAIHITPCEYGEWIPNRFQGS